MAKPRPFMTPSRGLCALGLALTLAGLSAGQLPLSPGSVVFTGWDGPGGTRVTTFDGRFDPNLQLGPLDSPVTLHTSGGTPPYNWDGTNLGGNVFGVAIDKKRNIYVASSAIYGGMALNSQSFGSGNTGGTIFRIRGGVGNLAGVTTPTGFPEAFTVLPNTGTGLGNLAYDEEGDRLYASNFEDGLIYIIDAPSTTVAPATPRAETYDHGLQGLPQEGRTPVADNTLVAFTPLERRVWGVGIRDRRLFYGTWREDKGRPSATLANEIWSVALRTDGGFQAGTARLELTMPVVQGVYSNPVSDIAFAPTGSTMFVAERVRSADFGTAGVTDSHSARLLEYHFYRKPSGKYAWMMSPATKFRLGADIADGANSTGGVTVMNDGRPWGTGDALYFDSTTPYYVYGVEGFPFSGANLNMPWSSPCYVVDMNGVTTAGDKTEVGSVESYDTCWDVGSGPVLNVMQGLGAGRIYEVLNFNDCGGRRFYVAGQFTHINGIAANNIAVWDGFTWSALGAGTNGAVHAMEIFDDGSGSKLHIGGEFTMADNLPASLIAKWNGSVWSEGGGGIQSVPGSTPGPPCIRALKAFAGSGSAELYATGRFVTNPAPPSMASIGITRWDGTAWRDLELGLIDDSLSGGFFSQCGGLSTPLQLPGEGFDLDVIDDGTGPNLYIGGRFTGAGLDFFSQNARCARCIGRWDGTAWNPMPTNGAVTIGTVRTLVGMQTANGPRIVAGGDFAAQSFQSPSGVVNRVGAYDWSAGDWSELGNGLDNTVYAMGLLTGADGTQIYATGDFLNSGSTALTRLARFDGQNWGPVRTTASALPIGLDGPGYVLEGGGAVVGQEIVIAGAFSNITGLFNPTPWPFFRYGRCCPDIFISVNPVSTSVVVNGSHTLSVVATSANPLTYQWKRNGADIPGANAASYTFTPTTADLYPTEYTVCISNGCSTIVACPAYLTETSITSISPPCCSDGVTPPPVLTLSSSTIGQPFTITVAPLAPTSTVYLVYSPPGSTTFDLCGCPLHIDLAAHAIISTASTGGLPFTFNGVVPNWPGFTGLLQAVVFDPTCAPNPPCPIPIPGCYCVTNAVVFTIGY